MSEETETLMRTIVRLALLLCGLVLVIVYTGTPSEEAASCHVKARARVEVESKEWDKHRWVFDAICQVESGGNPHAYNPAEDAVGIAQIRYIMVRDVNRILELNDSEFRFLHSDAADPQASLSMFSIYVDHYYPDGTPEEWARAWVGGPDGPRQDVTLPYWVRVSAHLEAR